MNRWRALLAGLGLFAATVSAARVQPPELGLSLWVPPHWLLTNEGGDEEFRLFTLYDTTGAHGALFQLEVNSGALASGTTQEWVSEEAMVRGFLIQGSCYGTLLSDDSSTIDGRYAREVYGRAATCDSSSSVLLSGLEDRFSRIMGSGNIGWVLSFDGDIADIDTAAGTYLALLDSMKIDPDFVSLPPVGILPHRLHGPSHRVFADGRGLRLELATEQEPEVQVMDLAGRILSGRLTGQGGGRWTWGSDVSKTGMIVVRIRSGSSQWMDRAVLPR